MDLSLELTNDAFSTHIAGNTYFNLTLPSANFKV